MNKEWAELNKELQIKLKKESTVDEGIKLLLDLRKNTTPPLTVWIVGTDGAVQIDCSRMICYN